MSFIGATNKDTNVIYFQNSISGLSVGDFIFDLSEIEGSTVYQNISRASAFIEEVIPFDHSEVKMSFIGATNKDTNVIYFQNSISGLHNFFSRTCNRKIRTHNRKSI